MATIVSTISGIDSGGFVWENVFHLAFTQNEDDIPTILSAINQIIIDEILDVYADAMTDKAKILDVSSKQILPNTSFTMHTPVNIPGTRALDPAVGQIAACITWLPVSGTVLGRLFAVGAAIGDFVLDIIDPAYEALVDGLGDVMVSTFNGTIAPYTPQLVIMNRETEVEVNVVSSQVKQLSTSLNKRCRA